MQESNKYKEAFDIYGRFKAERVIDFRDSRLGLIEDGSEHVTFKEFWRVFKAWKQANQDTLGGKSLNERDFQNRLDEDFGNLDKGIYKRVAVFDNEEGKEDFTKERMTTDPTMQV